MRTWTVAEAKAKLSEVIERARSDGPQRITRHGHTAAIVVGPSEWRTEANRKGNLAEFLQSSPFKGANLKVKPLRVRLHKLEL